MANESTRSSPPSQTETDPTAADRRLSDEQKQALNNEPDPPDPDRGDKLPDPKEVGEAG